MVNEQILALEKKIKESEKSYSNNIKKLEALIDTKVKTKIEEVSAHSDILLCLLLLLLIYVYLGNEPFHERR